MIQGTRLIPKTLLATAAALAIGGATAAMAQSYVVEPQASYVVEPGYVEAAPMYGSTVVVPAAPTIAVPRYSVTEPAYVEPRTVVIAPQTGYVPPKYSYTVPSRPYGTSSIRYVDPSGCILHSDGFCY